MSTHFKTALIGNAQGQTIINIIYHTDLTSVSVPTGASERTSFLNALDTQLRSAYLALFPASYTLNRMVSTVVNGRNETISDFEVEKVINQQGIRAGTEASVAQVGILAFRCSSIAGLPLNTVPKKTYLAIGPILESDNGPTGAWTPPATPLGTLITALQSPTTSGGNTYSPVRVGAYRETGNERVGVVSVILPRPYSSWRKSRSIRPSGEGV